MAERWGIDLEQGRTFAQAAASGPDMAAVWAEVYTRPASGEAFDVDEDLYGGFVGNNDRRKLASLRAETPEKLALVRPSFDDERLEELFFRYRARNFPQTLGEAEATYWEQHRAAKLFDGKGGARTIEQLFAEIDALSEDADERAEDILGALYDYAEAIAPTRQ
jgi:exodeoxyribonuclease-1